MATIAVTGSTGQLGGRVARRLGHSGHSSAGVAQRLLVRDLGRAPELERATDAHSDRHVSVYERRRPGLEGENPEIGRSMHESTLRRPDPSAHSRFSCPIDQPGAARGGRDAVAADPEPPPP